MSKSLLNRNLNAGVALVACLALGGMTMPAFADTAHHKAAKPAVKPVVKPVAKVKAKPGAKKAGKIEVSERFKKDAKVTAEQTVRVTQTGTSPANPVDVTDSPLPPVATTVEAPADVACGKGDSAWGQVPEELRRRAKPGECYARLLMAPQVEVITDHVLVSPERTETRTVPGVTRMVEKDVMVAPERVERRKVAAVVETRVDTEVVREASVREDVVPAQYETRVEHVLVSPAHQEWVKTTGQPLEAPLVTPGDHRPVRYRQDGYLTWPGKDEQRVQTDEEAQAYLKDGNPPVVWCLKDFPAVYRDEKHRVVVVPESVRRTEIPAVTRQVTHKVVVAPEHVEERTIPAVYEKRTVKEVVQEEHKETYTVPAVYKDVEKTRATGEAEGVWRQVLCSRNADASLVMKVQRALAAKGYNPGPIDGHLGGQTASAMQKFQADNELPQGQMSVEAVKALGIDPILVP